jgi:hypothetical protein
MKDLVRTSGTGIRFEILLNNCYTLGNLFYQMKTRSMHWYDQNVQNNTKRNEIIWNFYSNFIDFHCFN